MLENGEIDILNNVSKTPEREEIYDFPILFSGQNTAYLAMQPGDDRVAYGDLKGMESIKIGLAKDSIFSQRLVDYFKDNNVNANITWYSSRAEAKEAFKQGEVDAHVITSSTKSNEHLILSFSPEEYYIATTKGNVEIVQTIDSAITSLRENNPYFEVRLKEKYYGQAAENYSVLTEEEKEYVSSTKGIRVVYQADWYPICYQNEQGEFSGAIRKIYDLLEEKTGLDFEYIPIDTKDSSFDVLDKYDAQILGELPCDYSYANQFHVKLSDAFVTPPLTEVASHNLKAGDTIALIEEDYLSELTKKIYGTEYSYLYCDSIEECMELVKNGEADATVLLSYESEYFRSNARYSSFTYTIVDSGSYSLAIAVADDADPLLYHIIQKGLNAITPGEIMNIFEEMLQETRSEDLQTMIANHPVQATLVIVIIAAVAVSLILGYIFIRKLTAQNQIIYNQNEKLLQANSSTNEFLSRVSHDMRTPMNGILGIAQLSEDNTNLEQMKISMEKIKASGQYLLGLINDTLDYQKIESGKLTLDPQVASTREVIESTIAMLQPTAEEKGVEFKVTTKNADINSYVKIDVMRMKQIFVNLISNAIKFTPAGGNVEVSFECIGHDGMIAHDVITISDTGIGMSDEFLKDGIFKPFSQESNEVTHYYAGSGLGLSIVKKLVELMHGTISVESKTGMGATFTVCIDFERASDEEIAEYLEKKKETDCTSLDSLYGKNILIAEDHPLNAEIVTRILEKAKCVVTWAKDGKECLDLVTKSDENTYDAILMDIRMPVMNGLEAAKQIRALDRSDAQTIPIIAMTANAFAEDIQQSIDAGMNAHLSKPIDVEKLYQTLARMI